MMSENSCPLDGEEGGISPVVDPTNPPKWYRMMQQCLEELGGVGASESQPHKPCAETMGIGDLSSVDADALPYPCRFYGRMRLRGKFI